jgi:alkylation response protein AidB-like acyl-CoA dehydrogenase
MNLDFTEEQEMLRDSAEKFLINECPYDTVRDIEDSEEGYQKEHWAKMAELGWQGLIFPESYGGYEGQFLDLILLQEEMGKRAFPSPFFATVVQCGLAILEGGTEEQKQDLLPQIADGSLIMSLAQLEEEASYREAGIKMMATADGDGFTLTGKKMFAESANIADLLLVIALIEGQGPTLFLVKTDSPGLTINKLNGIGKDNISEIIFQNVKIAKESILGTAGTGWQTLAKTASRVATAKAAEMIGGARTSIDMTADYAKQREQYGKVIGGYQAIQHYMANMLLAYDTIHEYLYRVGCIIDMGRDADVESSILKAKTNENYKFISERAVQIHGAIGTTREYDIALFYRRAKSMESAAGDTDYHFDRIMDLSEDELPAY